MCIRDSCPSVRLCVCVSSLPQADRGREAPLWGQSVSPSAGQPANQPAIQFVCLAWLCVFAGAGAGARA
eukprot:2043866-Alexandrium_andersonii.AAC.1